MEGLSFDFYKKRIQTSHEVSQTNKKTDPSIRIEEAFFYVEAIRNVSTTNANQIAVFRKNKDATEKIVMEIVCPNKFTENNKR